MRCILTEAAQEFVTPLSVGALAGERVFTDLFDATSEFDIGHIRLAREADLIVVAPATADLMAKMANGLADDLASAVLLATDKQVLLAPAMNPRMWEHPATRRNLARLAADGVAFVGPNAGEMAESGEAGLGRMAEPLEIVAAADALLGNAGNRRRARGQARARHVGPDPRADRSGALHRQPLLRQAGPCHRRGAAAAGADVTLVSGPVDVPDPAGVNVVKVETAREMLAAVSRRAAGRRRDVRRRGRRLARGPPNAGKIKKSRQARRISALVENPDILATVAHRKSAAAAAGDRLRRRDRARRRARQGQARAQGLRLDPRQRRVGRQPASWAATATRSISSPRTASRSWPPQSKDEVAARSIARIAAALAGAKR